MRPRLALVLWWASLAATLWLLTIVGTGDLATPPAPWHWGTWLEEVEPAAGVVALVRLFAVAATWYLVLVTLVGAVGRHARTGGLVAAWDRVTPAFVRALLGSARGLTMSAVGLTVAVSPLVAPGDLADLDHARAETAGAPGGGEHVSQLHRSVAMPGRAQIGTDAPTARATLRRVNPGVDPVPATSDGIATLRRYAFDPAPAFAGGAVDPAPAFAGGAVDPAPAFAGGAVDPAGAHRPDTQLADAWTVESGDHFWHMAEDTLGAAWGRTPDEAEVASYWHAVVAHNRPRLVAETNPDLIYPGQVFELPPPPSDPLA